MTENFVTEIYCGYRSVYLAVIAEWSACCTLKYQKHIYIYIWSTTTAAENPMNQLGLKSNRANCGRALENACNHISVSLSDFWLLLIGRESDSNGNPLAQRGKMHATTSQFHCQIFGYLWLVEKVTLDCLANHNWA